MANPNIDQGNLNRLLASVTFSNLPSLNVTPSYLAPEAIDLAFDGAATTSLPTLTGLVNSPEPFLLTRVTIHLNRAQAFADLWKTQWELTTLLGPFTVRPDSSTIKPYNFNNGSIGAIDRLTIAGRDVGFAVVINGSYPINSNMWQ